MAIWRKIFGVPPVLAACFHTSSMVSAAHIYMHGCVGPQHLHKSMLLDIGFAVHPCRICDAVRAHMRAISGCSRSLGIPLHTDIMALQHVWCGAHTYTRNQWLFPQPVDPFAP